MAETRSIRRIPDRNAAVRAEVLLGPRGVQLLYDSIREPGQGPDSTTHRPGLSEEEELVVRLGRAAALQPDWVPVDLLAELKRRFSDEDLAFLAEFAGLVIAAELCRSVLDSPRAH